MVFKRYKGVIRSGNTLRLNNCGYIEQYSKNSIIEMVGCSSHAEYFEDQRMKFLDCFNVGYSLNKKGRWNLPEFIKGQLTTTLESCDCSVTLVELHSIRRSNNCVGIFTNKEPLRQLIPTKKKYLNGGSVIHVNRTSIGLLTDLASKCELLSRGNNHNKADDPNKYLLYRTIYPVDIKSSNVYSDPTIVNYKSRGKSWVSLKDTAAKPRIPKCKKRIVNVDEHIMVLNEEQEDELIPNTKVDSEGVYEPTIFVYDYLSHPSGNRKNRSRRRRRRGANRKIVKSIKLFFLETDDSESSSDDSLSDEGFIEECSEPNESMDSENMEDTTFVPVKLVLPKVDVSTEHLNCRFHDKIFFAKCYPRKFCIDIKNDVISTLTKSVYFKEVVWQKLDLTSYLVFSLVGNCDTLYDVYDVSINMLNKQVTVRIDTMYDMMVTDLEYIYNRTLKYIEGFLLPETFLEKDQLHLKARLCLEFKTIFPITVEVKIPDHNDVMNESERNKNNNKYLVSNSNENLEMALDSFVKFCGICLKGLADKAATSLQECGHWFCNACWKEHLHKELRQKKQKIKCPDCEEVVDYASMLTLANIHRIQIWQMEQFAKTNASDIRLCPNNQCGRTVRAIRKHSVGVCHCGVVVCLICGMEGHWPATCDQYAQYSTRLDSCVVRTKACIKPIKPQCGKKCPTCQIFLVNKSRSPFMVCAYCGQDFCWSCLRPQEIHPNDRSWCYKMEPTEGTHVQIVTDILGDFTDGDYYYQRAVESHKMRNPKHMKYMHSLVGKVRSKMLWWVHKNSLDQELSVCQLFTDIVDLFVELNFASEFCFVILEYENRRHTELICGVKDIAPRLQTIGFDLFNILSSFHTQNRWRTLSKLQQLKNLGKNALVSLLNLVCRHKA